MKALYRIGIVVLILVGAAGLALATTRLAPGQEAASGTATAAPASALDPWPVGTSVRVWSPPAGLSQEQIWPGDAPNLDGAGADPESVLIAETPEALYGDRSEAVFNVTRPTMTVYPPKGRNTGAAVVVFPGGGFRALAITLEGTEVCEWITARGMTCILSKYRVPFSNHSWDPESRRIIDPKPAPALQDAQRTIRLVRARAAELGVDPDKIGVMGFSAGGYLVAQTSNIFEPEYTPIDAVDRISSRPDFAIAFFPGHLCRSGRLDPGIHVTARTPPTFLLQAWDDPVDPICNSTLYARALNEAEVPSEVHLFGKGGHAFALRRDRSPDTVWPALLENWLVETGVLTGRRNVHED
ncbi:MAG: alpha/beta hydrolase [Alphaproteobacteria bacterium]|nr:alpha/beta hydrolase [Alphaproteobacteria bacterium]